VCVGSVAHRLLVHLAEGKTMRTAGLGAVDGIVEDEKELFS
jgi:hypothetical protein